MQYTRVFMPLACETTGYEYKGKTPAGRCLLESRSGEGKLLLWAQDLKPEALYRVYLIFPEGGTFVGIPLSGLTVKSNGKAELRHSFNPADIEGYGRNIENCSIVAILVAPGTSTPLCGYRDTPIAWRKTFKKLEKAPVEAKPVKESPKPPPPPPVILPDEEKYKRDEQQAKAENKQKDEPDHKDKITSKPKAESKADDSKAEPKTKQKPEQKAKSKVVSKTMAEITPEELEALTSKGEVITLEVTSSEQSTKLHTETESAVNKANKENISKDESPPPEKTEASSEGVREATISPERLPEGPFDYFEVKAAFEAEVEEIMRSHTRMYPFRKQKRSVHWARISLDEDLTLPEYANELLNTPFVVKAYRQYSHLLLGKTSDDGPKRYYIGVPSIYEPADKIIGFRQFKSCENETPVPGDYGYWLIFMS